MKTINPGKLIYDSEAKAFRHYEDDEWHYVDYERWMIYPDDLSLKVLDYDWWIFEGIEIIEWLLSHECINESKYIWKFPNEQLLSYFILKWCSKHDS